MSVFRDFSCGATRLGVGFESQFLRYNNRNSGASHTGRGGSQNKTQNPRRCFKDTNGPTPNAYGQGVYVIVVGIRSKPSSSTMTENKVRDMDKRRGRDWQEEWKQMESIN